MLLEFSVENAFSFKHKNAFSLNAATLKAENADLLIPVAENLNLLKAAAIYGANASGKSNFIKSMAYLKRLVLKSASGQAGEPLPVVKYELSTETDKLPFECEITILHQNIRYRYGFSAEKSGIVSEWLYGAPRGREALFFERQGKEISLGTAFKEARDITKFTRENALFLSVAAQFNIPAAVNLLGWFRNFNVIHGLAPNTYMNFTLGQLQDEKMRRGILDLIRTVDLGIEDIRLQDRHIAEKDLDPSIKARMEKDMQKIQAANPDTIIQPQAVERRIKTLHHKYTKELEQAGSVEFDLDRESHGTRKFMGLAGPILDTLKNGKVLVIDEIEAQLHPLITQKIISLFNSAANKTAQLIFATHDTNLLDHNLLRRDQIWFVEKNDRGESKLYPLTDFHVRRESNIYADYLEGQFGGVPIIRDNGE